MGKKNQIVVIKQQDNVGTALTDLQRGSQIFWEQRVINIIDNINFGHKVALVQIAQGDKLIKYGEEIGVATTDIKPGAHVHIHNVRSQRSQSRI